MTRSTQRGGFQRQSRRISDWGVGPNAQEVQVTAPGKTLWSSGTTPSANLTVVRTRGIFSIHMASAAAAGQGFFGAVGIYMMTEDAFNVGVTAALDPLADANSDMWLWHSFFDVRLLTATVSDGVNAVAAIQRIVIDSKAMRKNFDPERVMVGVVGVDETGTAVAEYNADCRQLFKT